jgi:endoribonuclease LACTB2
MQAIWQQARLVVSAFTSAAMRHSTSSRLAYKLQSLLTSSNTAAPKHLAPLAAWDRLSDAVVRVTGLNPSLHTLQGTNTYLVGTGSKRLLLDTGEKGKPMYLDLLLRTMQEVGCSELAAIICTHYHADHVGGVGDILKRFKGSSIPVYKRTVADAACAVLEVEHSDIADGQLFSVEGATLQAVHTPGHTADHCSFVLIEEAALFSGDMILGDATAVFDDFTSYMASLQRVLQLSEAATTSDAHPVKLIYPGHGEKTIELYYTAVIH